MQVLCGLQGIFLLFNCQTPGSCGSQGDEDSMLLCLLQSVGCSWGDGFFIIAQSTVQVQCDQFVIHT